MIDPYNFRFSSTTAESLDLTTMPPSNPNVPAAEETVVTYQSIDLEAPSPAVTLPELNETVPNVSLSEELVASSTSTTHRYLFNETSQIEMFSVIFPAARHVLCAAIVICIENV